MMVHEIKCCFVVQYVMEERKLGEGEKEERKREKRRKKRTCSSLLPLATIYMTLANNVKMTSPIEHIPN